MTEIHEVSMDNPSDLTSEDSKDSNDSNNHKESKDPKHSKHSKHSKNLEDPMDVKDSTTEKNSRNLKDQTQVLHRYLYVRPPYPGFVLCQVEVFSHQGTQSEGILNEVVRYIPSTIQPVLSMLEPVIYGSGEGGESGEGGSLDRYLTIRLEIDQTVEVCEPYFLSLTSCSLARVSHRSDNPFSTICDYELECANSGHKLFQVSKFAVESVGGGYNREAVILDIPYEKSRPSITLLDVTGSGGLASERSLLAVFSHDVGELPITAIVCEDCLVLRQNRLNARLLQFSVVSSREATPGITMRCYISENVVKNAAGMFNVRSTALSLFVPTGPLLIFFQPMPPITSNSTLVFSLITSEPFSLLYPEDFTVRNGYLVNIDTVLQPVTHDDLSLFSYALTVKATIEGSVCIDLAKSPLRSLHSRIDTLTTHVHHMRNPLPLSACCDYDSLFPYLIAASPSVPVTNTRLFWMVFEFSEPLLLLYNPALSFLENLQLFSVERLLSTLCAPGMSGQCISFGNAQVRDAAVASNRLAFQLEVTQDGTVTAHIPRELITDWAGNQLKEDVDKSIDVRGSDITLVSAQLIAFSRGSFRPEVRFQFSTAVEIAPNSTRSICSWDGRSAARHCVAPRDTRILGDAVRVDVDSVYSPRNTYAISIPPGYLCDRYRNFYEGFAEGSFRVSTRMLWPIELAHAANPGWIAVALLLFLAGGFIAIAGWGCWRAVTDRYKNVYHSVIAANALLVALVYLACCLLLLAEWTQKIPPLLVDCVVLLLAALALASSVAVIRVAPSLALRLFGATLGFVLGVGLERLATDCVLYAIGFIAGYLASPPSHG